MSERESARTAKISRRTPADVEAIARGGRETFAAFADPKDHQPVIDVAAKYGAIERRFGRRDDRAGRAGTALMSSLSGQVALVTGGGSGIGRATSILLAQHGAKVAVADRNTEGAGETCATIVKAGGKAVAIPVEVSDSASVDRMVATAEKELGNLDILVHGAGILKIVSIVETSDEDWHRVLSVNLDGTFYAARAAARDATAEVRPHHPGHLGARRRRQADECCVLRLERRSTRSC